MAVYVINGGYRLNGEIDIQGSKNAVLPLMAAAIIGNGCTIIDNCPEISDVYEMAEILRDIGCIVTIRDHTMTIDSSNINNVVVNDASIGKVRASVLLAGALLARCGYVRMNYPGGCLIGARPIGYHLDAFEELGAKVIRAEDYIECKCAALSGKYIRLPFPSVGATENILLAAAGTSDITVIDNCAREPEITELCMLLGQYGCYIDGAGTSKIRIKGRKDDYRSDVRRRVAGDRIVAGTYIYAAVITRGDITCRINNCSTLAGIINPLMKMGCLIEYGNDYIKVKQNSHLINIPCVVTEPYPGFPTDMQSQLMSLMATAKGTGIIHETIFENRFHTAGELVRMGADIVIHKDRAVINGTDILNGATVTSKDLRGGAALVIAGLGADGETRVFDEGYIERGYENITGDLRRLGGSIRYEK